MTIRTDVSVEWDVSPRIIEVAAPSTEITIQDLVDTVRELEEDLLNLSYPRLLDCAGKQYLSPGKYVGITVELQDARVKFEDRVSWTRCKVIGGNLVAYNINGDSTEAIEVSDFTQVTVELDVSPALITVQGGSGLSQAEHDRLYALPTSTLEIDERTKLLTLPTLIEIEASTVLAKQADMIRALGLMQENSYMDQCTYTEYEGAKLLASARIRIYSNAGSVGTGSDVIATYLVTPVWTNDELTTYKVVKQ